MALLSQLLAIVPDHHEDPLSADEILQKAQKNCAGLQVDRPTVDLLIEMLLLFDCLERRQHRYRAQNQIATYFLKSLAWYDEAEISVCSNWQRVGTAGHVSSSNLLERAPHLLKAIEERRLSLMHAADLPIRPSRTQACSLVLIKDSHQKLLHQWDQDAKRFQLIGGKQRESESPLETAIREFQEEVSHDNLRYSEEFSIHQLFELPITELSVSNTYGALTKYELFFFVAKIDRARLDLGAGDRWISFEEMKAETTADGRKVAGVRNLLSESQFRQIEHMPAAFVGAKSGPYLPDYLEMKPGFLGFKIDLRRMINLLAAKRGDK